MATTNEDPAMVKYLLDAGVNFQVEGKDKVENKDNDKVKDKYKFKLYGKLCQSICTAFDFYRENISLFQEPCFGNFFCTTDQQPSRF